jgi:hypothetical protein
MKKNVAAQPVVKEAAKTVCVGAYAPHAHRFCPTFCIWLTSSYKKTYWRNGDKKMKRRLVILLVVLMMAAVAVIPASANRGNGELGVVYVSSQGLYYDTFVSAETLPPQGRFQKLEDGVTEFGPGDKGYVGGRWWCCPKPLPPCAKHPSAPSACAIMMCK